MLKANLFVWFIFNLIQLLVGLGVEGDFLLNATNLIITNEIPLALLIYANFIILFNF